MHMAKGAEAVSLVSSIFIPILVFTTKWHMKGLVQG